MVVPIVVPRESKRHEMPHQGDGGDPSASSTIFPFRVSRMRQASSAASYFHRSKTIPADEAEPRRHGSLVE
jgi:hypothetical protein